MIEYISKKNVREILLNQPSRYDALENIKSAPSADVRENIHGHWEEDSKEGFHHCSKCGQIIFSCQKWFKCCPKCMAVMDEKPFKNCPKTKCEACIYQGHCDREDMREPKGEKGTE